jgi:hypothetical protein
MAAMEQLVAQAGVVASVVPAEPAAERAPGLVARVLSVAQAESAAQAARQASRELPVRADSAAQQVRSI